MFREMDKNGDGRITKEELEVRMDAVRTMSTDARAYISICSEHI